MELPNTCVLLDCYKTLTPSIMLSNFPLPVALLSYVTQYNSKEWNPFSS
jgi:hypothetical protein